MVHFSPSIEQRKQFYNCEANSLWCSYNEWTNCLRRRLLANCLHGKAVELCSANHLNNSKQLQNTLSTLIASTACIHGTRYSFYHMVLVKYYCDVINRSCLQFINALIDTFFSKLHAFSAEQRRRRKANGGQKEARWRSKRIFSRSRDS